MLRTTTILLVLSTILLLLAPEGEGIFGWWGRRRRRRNCPSAWTAWGGCSTTCGPGKQSSSQTLCDGTTKKQQKDCGDCCKVNCVWGKWSKWGACSVTCGKGKKKRTRKIFTAADCKGKDCTGKSSQKEDCDTGVCCPVDCVVGTWGPWTKCNAACQSSGFEYSYRPVTQAASCGGKACPPTKNSATCKNTACCKQDCVVSKWSAWSACSTTCGGGTHTRTSKILTKASCGGTSCPKTLKETKKCIVVDPHSIDLPCIVSNPAPASSQC